MGRTVIENLRRLSTISPLPAWGSTLAVWVILLAAAAGLEPARRLWHEDSTAIISLYLGQLGIWLGTKAATRISDAIATKGESVETPPAVAP